MTALVEAPSSAHEARAALARGSRSFSWATTLLGSRVADDVARLYAFCRRVDDLADEHGASGREELLMLSEGLRRDPVQAGLPAIVAEEASACAAAHELVDACLADLDGRRIDTPESLVQFARGVAGTVGLMLLPVLGCRNPAAVTSAVDLGIALQLTNVARDVLEDAGRDRIYLPATWVGLLDSADLLDDRGGARRRAFGGVEACLALAESYYAGSERGLCHLPLRSRAAVLTAARVYRGIGTVILADRDRYWTRRAVVSRSRKVWHTLGALGSLLLRRDLGAARAGR
ncbi:MAG: phytoene/squalene synthase family protein [Planctomycetota bacterium]|jgi:phytoene synthase